MNNTLVCFASSSPSFSNACLSSAMVVGQISGQDVYPKKSITAFPRISLSRKRVPLARVNSISAARGYGSAYIVPRKPSGFEKRITPAATAPTSRKENKPTSSILLSMILPNLSLIHHHTSENRGDQLAAPILSSLFIYTRIQKVMPRYLSNIGPGRRKSILHLRSASKQWRLRLGSFSDRTGHAFRLP